jgi:hypothetical protein
VAFDTSRNVITIDHGKTPPDLSAGGWLLDSTVVKTNVGGIDYRTLHGFFYRVVAINELTATTTEYEVDPPLRGFGTPGAIYNPSVIVLAGVAEVFEKGTGK